MRELWNSLEFWVAMAVVALIKITASKNLPWVTAAASVAVAVGSALVLTGPCIAYFELDPASATIPVAVLIGLTGEQTARQIQSIPIKEAIAAWRGKGTE